jgi:hypothetical protein
MRSPLWAQLSFPFLRRARANPIKQNCERVTLAILVLSGMDTSLGQEKLEAQIAKQPTIKVQTTLLMVPAIVADRSASHSDDLKEPRLGNLWVTGGFSAEVD